MAELVRLQKFFTDCGRLSRRAAEAEIVAGKVLFSGMPQLDAKPDEADTLIITLRDEISGCETDLYYSVFEKEDIISRRTVVRNVTDQTVQLQQAASAMMDMESAEFDFVTLAGAWGRERYVERSPLRMGTVSVDSRRGASSHALNPFAALARKNTDDKQGEVYGFSLIYSADFRISVEVSAYNNLRLSMGIQPDTFSWELAPGAQFVTPEALLTFSDKGFNGMSQNFHEICRRQLGKSADRSMRHPVIINSWEAMYFDITEEKLRQFAQDSKDLGIDVLVLDDGWFGHRDRDNSSLGDWYVDKRKFPNGLKPVIDACHENGMDFGIWVEPEMISADSDLYRAHPDWAIHCDDLAPIESRWQLVLDMARPEIVDYIYEKIAAILAENDIAYVKWDMNRNLTDNGSAFLPAHRQKEHTHRYMLGVYDLMDRLTKRFPHIFFEGCSGGGGRFDFGILYYMPQFWTSDNSDAIQRLKIQYGTSMVYPPESMVAHVSACPNHQNGRVTPFETRGEVAQMCSFGYELDPGKLTDGERAAIRQQIRKHRRLEFLTQNGDFYRLVSPFETEECGWQIVSKDKKESYVMFCFTLGTTNDRYGYLRLEGLDPDGKYEVAPLGVTLTGATLMNAGLPLRYFEKDFVAVSFELKQV
jgi:alpha-galactosidase